MTIRPFEHPGHRRRDVRPMIDLAGWDDVRARERSRPLPGQQGLFGRTLSDERARRACRDTYDLAQLLLEAQEAARAGDAAWLDETFKIVAGAVQAMLEAQKGC